MDGAFDDLMEANRAYAGDFALSGLPAPAARQLGVLTCIDSRISPLDMLGIAPGDAKIFRNAGARVTPDSLRSLTLATHLLDVRRIMIVAHTDCAMGHTTDAELRARVNEIHPGAIADDVDLYAVSDPEATLVADVRALRTSPMLATGVVVGGFIYDVDTGLLREVPAATP